MSKKKSKQRSPTKTRGVTFGLVDDMLRSIETGTYTKLADCPEVQTCVHVIADTVSNMPIHLMRNTPQGDMRVVNGLSRALDIEPNALMTRKDFIYWIVKMMLLEGNADVFPRFDRNYELQSLEPITGYYRYKATPAGFELSKPPVTYRHDEILHFPYNPSMDEPWRGEGFKVHLKDIATNLKQASLTKKAFMTDQFRPTVVIGVDGLTDEMSYEDGRDSILEQFGANATNGKPWVVPSGMLQLEQIKPLSLQDIAIDATVQLDKKTVGALFQVPPYYLGLAEYKKDEHNAFIAGPVKSIATKLQQVFTKGLLYSPEYYWRFNAMSIYNYSIQDTYIVFAGLSDRGITSPNEVRDKFGFSPLPGMDKPRLLENYIPADQIGDQKKLVQDDEKEEGGEQ